MQPSIKSSCLTALVVIFSNALVTYPACGKINDRGLEAPINGKLAVDAESDSAADYPTSYQTDYQMQCPTNTSTDTAADYPANAAISSPPITSSSDAVASTASPYPAAQSWQLPMNGPVNKAGQSSLGTTYGANNNRQTKQYTGSIAMSDAPTLVSRRIDQLLDSALEHDGKTQSINRAVQHFNTNSQKIIAQAKDATDYLVPYRGFGPSSEAGDIILDEKVKLKSKAADEYARQEEIDEMHVKIVTYMSQIAMGLGIQGKVRSAQVVASGTAALTELVGRQEAEKTTAILADWANSLNVPDQIYKQDVWDVAQREDKLKTVIESALSADPVVQEVKRRLHKYNHRSKFANASAHVVETTLGAASMTPTFVGPAAKTALLAFVMATGGPESCKLMKELYLDKRYESRAKVVDQEAHLALDNYHVALLTHNKALLAFSESLVGEMAGGDNVPKILGPSVLTWAAAANDTAGSAGGQAAARSAAVGL